MELESGSVDAIALDIGVAKSKLSSGKYRMLDEAVLTEKHGIGFKKGNKRIRDAVEKTLIEMVKDGTAAKISEKYFDGKDVLIIGKDLGDMIKTEFKNAAVDGKAPVNAELKNLKDTADEVKDAAKDMLTVPFSSPETEKDLPTSNSENNKK